MLVIAGVVVVLLLLVALYLFMGSPDSEGPVELKVPETGEEKAEQMMAQEGGGGTGVEVEGLDEEGDEAEDEAEAVEEVPEDEPDIDPKSIKSLVGYYTGESWDEDNNVWKDISGKNNHATEILGTPEVIEEDGIKYVLGGPKKGVRFPAEVMTAGKKYTMLAVTKQNSDNSGGRMFDGYGNGANYLAGHWHWGHQAKGGPQYGGMSGAHRSGTGWISHNAQLDQKGDEWVLITDQKLSYRVNGIQRSGHVNDEAIVPLQMSINYGDFTNSTYAKQGHWWGQQNPDWSAGEVLFFNDVLDKDTIRKLEAFLMKKYKIPRRRRMHVNMLNGIRWEKGTWNWGGTIDDCSGGGTCADQFKALDKLGFSCGDDGAATFLTFHRHHRDHPNGGNGRFWYYQNCTQGLLPGVTEKKTETINISDSSSMADKFKKLDMDCRKGGISSGQWKLIGNNRMRIDYTCSNAPVNKGSCEEITAKASGTPEIHPTWGSANDFKNVRNNERDPNKGPITALDLQWLDCGRGKVLTGVKYGENDEGMMRLKGTCCSLEDE